MASTGEVWRLGRRPALDGLRGVAVLLVVACHTDARWFTSAGQVGVTIFFVLSGFLITSLLLEELRGTGTVSLRKFYLRRARRLFPGLAAFLLVMLAVDLLLPDLHVASFGEFAAATLYVGNWWVALDLGSLGAIVHTWSLAVEEQFYLVWPLLVLGAVRRRYAHGACLALMAAGAAGSAISGFVLWRNGAGGALVYNSTLTRADALLAGCLLATAMAGRSAGRNAPRLATAAVVAALPLAPLAWWGRVVLAPTIAVALATVAIAAVVQAPTYDGWLSSRWLVLVGRRSYGLYLWNFPLLRLGLGPLSQHLPWLLSAAILIAAAWALAQLSWRYVEEPFLAGRWSHWRGAVRDCDPRNGGGAGRGPGSLVQDHVQGVTAG